MDKHCFTSVFDRLSYRQIRGQKLLCLLTIYLTVTECGFLPKTPARKLFQKKKHEFVLPKDFQTGKNVLANAKIPNREFCSEMILKPEDHYLVLPWWYNYCQDLKEKSAHGIQGNINYDSVHKYILAEVQLYKKRLSGKKTPMSELEQELVAFNKANEK